MSEEHNKLWERAHSIKLPALTKPSGPELAALAHERAINIEALRLLASKPRHRSRMLGVIRQGGNDWWALADCTGRLCVFWPLNLDNAARIDAVTRAKVWRGSWLPWPLGLLEASKCPALAITFSPRDFLAAAHFIFEQQVWNVCAPVACLQKETLIPEGALRHFRGKRVRIFPPPVEGGDPFAGQYIELAFQIERQLERVAASVLTVLVDLSAPWGTARTLADSTFLWTPEAREYLKDLMRF
jgi:hypothetical protein